MEPRLQKLCSNATKVTPAEGFSRHSVPSASRLWTWTLLKKVQNSSPRHTSSISKVGQLTMDAWGSALRVIDAMKSCVRWYSFVCWWLESASFTENLDESSASVKKRCEKYLSQVATMPCNVSQRVSRKVVWKIKRIEVHFEFLLCLWNWTIIGYNYWILQLILYYYVIVFLV